MDIPTIPGAWYTVATATTCDITDTATGTPLGTADAGSYSFQAQGNLTTLSDDSALYSKSNFKSAPAALMALGLLGGGASTGIALPSGYIAAEFLENERNAYIKFSAPFNNALGIYVRQVQKDMTQDVSAINTRSVTDILGERIYSPYLYSGKWYIGWNEWVEIKTNASSSLGKKSDVKLNYFNDRKASVENSLEAFSSELTGTITENKVRDFLIFSYGGGRHFLGQIYQAKLTENNSIIRDFIPCINEEGKPCLFEKMSKQTFFNSGAGAFIVGMTLSQALKLASLPATGGSLTVSLPTDYASDSGVMAALEKTRANGWTLTIQTYTPEASAAATTFSLRRIWVRRTQNETGSYVAADGSRWHVDWCVDMLTPDGSTPDAYGYELFRSQEAAVAYWDLTPYVDPEAENLLT